MIIIFILQERCDNFHLNLVLSKTLILNQPMYDDEVFLRFSRITKKSVEMTSDVSLDLLPPPFSPFCVSRVVGPLSSFNVIARGFIIEPLRIRPDVEDLRLDRRLPEDLRLLFVGPALVLYRLERIFNLS